MNFTWFLIDPLLDELPALTHCPVCGGRLHGPHDYCSKPPKKRRQARQSNKGERLKKGGKRG